MATATPLGNIKALAFDAYGTLFDVFSVMALCEQLFPGNGTALAQLWRAKQLQYSLLRSLMGRYKDFWQLTEDGLLYASKSLKLDLTASKQRQLMDAYLNLTVFPDVSPGLAALKKLGLRLAILSNGEPKMLDAAAKNAGIDAVLDAIISADELKVFKPSPQAYALIETTLGTSPREVLFISSNPWDACGAKAFGLHVAWIERVTSEAMALACVESETVAPLTMFKAIRTQMDELGIAPDYRIRALSELPKLIAFHES